jgi:hypothetical protein
MGKFKRGQKRSPRAGRRQGSPNRTTGLLKEAVLLAAELEGDVSLQEFKTAAQLHREGDLEAAKRGGLVGYLRYVARYHPPSFVTLLGRVLPLQVRVDARTESVIRTVGEIREEMARRGVPLEAVVPLLIEQQPLKSEDEDAEAEDDVGAA